MIKEQNETKERKFLPLTKAFRIGSKSLVRVEENLQITVQGKVGIIDLNINGEKALVIFPQKAFNDFVDGEQVEIKTIQKIKNDVDNNSID